MSSNPGGLTSGPSHPLQPRPVDNRTVQPFPPHDPTQPNTMVPATNPAMVSPGTGPMTIAGPASTRGALMPLSKVHNPHSSFPGRGGSPLYFSSDDRVLSKRVEETHVPDDNRVDEVRPLFSVVQDLLQQTMKTVHDSMPGTYTGQELGMRRALQPSTVNIPNLSLILERIACELACRQWGPMTTDAHETTMSILRLLSHFTWDAKVVLTLAAFAMSYGEFWLLAQIFSSNHLAHSMAVLKQLPLVMENTGSYKSIFDAINEVIQGMLSVTDCIIQIKEIPPVYMTEDDPAIKAARTQVPIAVYWTIRSAVTAGTEITSLTNMAYEYMASATEVYELQNRAHKLKTIYDHFMMILNKLKERIDKRREDEEYEMLVNVIYKMIHVDNMPVLRRIVTQQDLVLYDGTKKQRVHIDVSRRKNILLLISDLSISMDELSILEQIYNDTKIHAYEILWLPIVDRTVPWTEPMQTQFEKLQATMPWYSVYHPSMITNAFIRFARFNWNFRSKPVLAVLDPRGKVLSPNAMHMMLIWGSNAFPFTTDKEEMLWRDELWSLDLLIDGIDPTVLDWIREGKYIFIYGGDDINLIRRFTRDARAVAQAAGIKLEMIYVGKSDKRDLVQKISTTIADESLSNSWQDPPMVWFFWKRIESMLFSKLELKKADDHSDTIIQEVKKVLSYDKFPGGWALLSRGSEVVLHGQMSAIVTALARYERETPFWKNSIPPLTFDEAFRKEATSIHSSDVPCCRFEFPAMVEPVGMLCPECRRRMEKHTTFVCCHEGAELAAPPTFVDAGKV